MLAFKNSLTQNAEGQRGTIRAIIDASSGTDMAYVQFKQDTNLSNGCLFLAFDTTNAECKADCYVHSETGPTDIEYLDRDFFTPIAKSSSACTRSDNGGTLLGWANLWKDIFFNGETQTAATLYAWLCEKYGNHDAFFCSTQALNALFDPDHWAGNIVSQERSFDYGTARDITFDPTLANMTFTGGSYGTIVSDYPDASAQAYKESFICASLVFDLNVKPPTLNELNFDVYIDGTKDPNIAIRWTANTEDDFSLQLVTPWVFAKAVGSPDYKLKTDDGIVVPNTDSQYMAAYNYTWAGEYTKPYLTEFAAKTSQISTFQKTIYFGFDGIADSIDFLLRFNYQKNEDNTGVMTWGHLIDVNIPRDVNSIGDVGVEVINNSEKDPQYVTNVTIHLGTPPDDIPDDSDDYPDGQDFDGNPDGVYDDDDIHDFDTGKPTGFSGKALLTKTYAMTALRTQNLGTKLWTQSYFDVLKIQNNPIENVVSMKWFPFSVSGTDAEIKIGNVLMGTNGEVVDSIYKFTVGSVFYRPKNNGRASFLDCSPYTQIKLHLPYCGIVQLDASEMLNRKITVSYVVDLVSGDCMAFIELDGTEQGEKRIPFMSVSGHIGVDIPLTASNRIQSEMRAASTAISAVSGAAAHVIGGDVAGGAVQAAQGALSVAGMDYTTQRTAAHSPACMTHENRTVFLEIWRPAYDEEISTNNGFKSRHGFPTYKYKTIGELSGFVKCDARTKIDFAMTGRENQMLEELLTSGVYV